MTSFALPTYSAPGASWQLIDYKARVIAHATADATGKASVAVGGPDPGFLWSVQRAVATGPNTSLAQLRLYDGDPGDATALFTGTNTAAYDEGEYPSGALVEGGRQITAVWTGADQGDNFTVRLQVAVLQQVSG